MAWLNEHDSCDGAKSEGPHEGDTSSDEWRDDDAQSTHAPLSQTLAIPIRDLDVELSVRTRTCLYHMGVMTLGDLCRCTEQELLANKTLTEISLVDIKDLLASKNLRLGQLPGER